jgi:putative peptidoglycan lipid II flippase
MNICIIGGALAAAFLFPVHMRNNTANTAASYSFEQPAVKQLFTLAIAILIAGIVEFAVQLPPLYKTGAGLRFAWDIYSKPFRKIITLMLPMVVGLSVTQINTLADDLIAWWFSGSVEKGKFFTMFGHQIQYPLERGSVSCLNFAQHLYQLPLGIFGISLATALFPVMSRYAARKEHGNLCSTISLGMSGSVFIALPCSVGLIMIAHPFISIWLKHGNFKASDIPNVTWPLIFYSVGITGYFMQHIVTRAFYSLQDSKMPLRSGLTAVAVNFILNLVLLWFLSTGGLALSTSICSYLQVVILLMALHKRLGGMLLNGFWKTLIKTAAATAAMAGAGGLILYAMRNFPSENRFDILRLALVIPVSAGAYLLVSKVVKIEELALLSGKKTKSFEETIAQAEFKDQ